MLPIGVGRSDEELRDVVPVAPGGRGNGHEPRARSAGDRDGHLRAGLYLAHQFGGPLAQLTQANSGHLAIVAQVLPSSTSVGARSAGVPWLGQSAEPQSLLAARCRRCVDDVLRILAAQMRTDRQAEHLVGKGFSDGKAIECSDAGVCRLEVGRHGIVDQRLHPGGVQKLQHTVKVNQPRPSPKRLRLAAPGRQPLAVPEDPRRSATITMLGPSVGRLAARSEIDIFAAFAKALCRPLLM